MLPDPHAERAVSLFDRLPQFPPALADDELQLLASLPEWPTQMELRQKEEPPARRLQKRGLIEIEWAKTDPINIFRTGFAGKLPAASLQLCANPLHPAEDRGESDSV